MKFAINYSPQAQALIDDGKIEIDLFKCPDWVGLVADAQKNQKAYIHFPISIGRETPIADLDLGEVERWIEKTDTVHVNAHISPIKARFPDNIDREGVLETLIEDTEILTSRFGKDYVVLENIPFHRHNIERGNLEYSVDPDLIRELVETTGCGFLFDISHAQLSCDALGYDYSEYVAKLPMHRLMELHTTGIGLAPDGHKTDHLELLDADWRRLEDIVTGICDGKYNMPRIMAFEYGGITEVFDWRSEPHVIESQVPRMMALTRSVALASQ